MNVGSKHWTTISLAHLQSFKTQSQVLKKRIELWLWAAERDTVKNGTHGVDLAPLSYP